MYEDGTQEEVMAMYSKWPYPSRATAKSLIFDIASLFSVLLPGDTLRGWRILDAGCGTGQRLVGFAKRFPEAEFTGIDMTDASLEIAAKLASAHGVRNVEFEKQDIHSLTIGREFDAIVSTGVVHHLEDPRIGLHNLCRLLAQDGFVIVWHYHSFGEFERLVGRELLRTLWFNKNDMDEGLRLMDILGLRLDTKRYGIGARQSDARDVDQVAIEVDAYMHPIVNTYRIEEGARLFSSCPVTWVAVNGINMTNESKLIDLDDAADNLARPLCLSVPDALASRALDSVFRQLDSARKLRVIELITKPTGFTLIAGKGRSTSRLGKRLQGNHIALS